MRKNLGIVKADYTSRRVIAVLMNLSLDLSRDPVLLVLSGGTSLLFFNLRLIVLAHSDKGAMQGIRGEIRSALCTITPDGAVNHQTLQVEHLLSTVHLPLR